jgi:hypothetical protein
MDRDELLRAGDLNLVEVLRHYARHHPGGVVHEEDGVALFAGSPVWPGPFDDGAFVLDPRVEPDRVLELAARFFKGLRPAYSVWFADHHDPALEHAALDAGLALLGEGDPQMVLRARLADAVPPPGVELRQVVDDTTRADYLTVLRGSFTPAQGTPAEVFDGYFGTVESLHAPHVRTVVAYAGGRPVAGAMVLVSHGVAGVQYVGTVEDARGRGYGELVTRWVGNAGFDLGARVAALQASDMGEPVYRRMGYETVTTYRYAMSS